MLRAAPKRRGRPPKGASDGREALLAAAFSAFAQNGYEAASLRVIAAVAGVDMALVSRHFGSKSALWMAVVDRMAEHQQRGLHEFEAIRDAQASGAWKLAAFIRIFTRFNAEVPDFAAFLLRAAVDADRQVMFVDRVLAPLVDVARAIILAAIADRTLPPLDPVLFFFMLTSAIAYPIAAGPLVARMSGLSAEGLGPALSDLAVALFAPDRK